MSYLKTFLPYLFGNKKGQKIRLPQVIPWGSLSFEETLMFHALEGHLIHFLQELNPLSLTKSELFHTFNFRNYFSKKFKNEFDVFSEAVNATALTTLQMQEILNFKNNQLTVFAIVPTNRRILGKLIIKKNNGNFVEDKSGNIWSLPILACSGRGLPFHHTNGQTPMGVYTIDGVMPKADKNYEFGKDRRLIVNFAEAEDLIPSSEKTKFWWKQAVLAKELGRSLLRIHGTGRVNYNIFTSFFPFVPTSGCIATNEKANGQRELLDTLMAAQGLNISFQNEVKIKAILYVVEYNGNFSQLQF